MYGYAWRWRAQPIAIVASEQQFVLPLINPATGAASKIFRLAGKIDGIALLSDGRMAVREHKTTSEDVDASSDFWRRLQLDAQPSIYVYAARQLGYDVSAVIYDVVRKPTIRPTDVPVLDQDGLKVVVDQDGKQVFKKDNKPYQAPNKAKGWSLQTRSMTPTEWAEKLVNDIGQRPEWYFARREIARLDDEIEECQAGLWEIQQTLREAQRTDRWYRTVGRDTCPYCPYWGPCSSKQSLDPDSPPEGFAYVSDVHPELELQETIQ
jgi:hypothetical protein